jgi:ferritin-like metal-binding protein YciE
LRDTALIGAFRKGKQAERVSYETAVLLARRLGMKDVEVRLTAFRGQEEQADRELESLLQATIGILTVQPE